MDNVNVENVRLTIPFQGSKRRKRLPSPLRDGSQLSPQSLISSVCSNYRYVHSFGVTMYSTSPSHESIDCRGCARQIHTVLSDVLVSGFPSLLLYRPVLVALCARCVVQVRALHGVRSELLRLLVREDVYQRHLGAVRRQSL